MTKEFVSYEIALELRKLGFEEPCFKSYDENGKLIRVSVENQEVSGNYELKYKNCTAPLFQQVFRFFREKYNLLGNVYSNASGYGWEIHDAIGGTNRFCDSYEGDCEMSGMYTTFNKAENACIEKLIKITKNGKL